MNIDLQLFVHDCISIQNLQNFSQKGNNNNIWNIYNSHEKHFLAIKLIKAIAMDIKASWLKVIIISPLEKGVALLLNTLESPLPMQGCFLPNLVEISWPIVVMKKRKKM